MNWFTGFVVFVLIWWTALFAILPIGTRPVADADEATGWRGAPAAPRIGRVVLWTTVVACVGWAAFYALVSSDWISFRHGWFALPQN